MPRPKKQVDGAVGEQTLETPQNVITEASNSLLEKLVETVAALTQRIEAIETKPARVLTETNELSTPTPSEATVETKRYPVPVDYREVVDSVLNKSFDIEVEPHADGPMSTVTIIVPDRYSNMLQSHRDIVKQDRRVKVISYAEGANGLRDYAEKVFNNLGPQIQAMVVADRITGN